jgi:hypothetical protein
MRKRVGFLFLYVRLVRHSAIFVAQIKNKTYVKDPARKTPWALGFHLYVIIYQCYCIYFSMISMSYETRNVK